MPTEPWTAYARGIYFISQLEGSPKLAWTSEFSFNPANYTSLSFNWRQGNNDMTAAFQLAIRIGGSWFVNNTLFNNDPDYTDGIGFFNAEAQQKTLVYDKAAANWTTLDFDGTWDATTNTGTDSTVPLALGVPAAADLSGQIDGFGLFSGIHLGTRRFDTFEIKGTLIGGKPGDFNTDNDRRRRGLPPLAARPLAHGVPEPDGSHRMERRLCDGRSGLRRRARADRGRPPSRRTRSDRRPATARSSPGKGLSS